MPKRLTIRLANLWRENPRVVRDLHTLLGDRAAHVVGLNEAGDFTAEVRAAATACGYQVFGDTGTRPERMNPVLIRNDVRVFDSEVRKMCDAVGISPERHATVVWFEFAGKKRKHVHTHANSHVQHGGIPQVLPRVGQYVTHMRRLGKLVDKRTTVSGDLNWSYSARVLGWYWSPRRVFKRLGMTVQWAGRGAPHRGSHGRRRIDYIAHDPADLAIEGQRLITTHSDHKAPEVTYRVKESR